MGLSTEDRLRRAEDLLQVQGNMINDLREALRDQGIRTVPDGERPIEARSTTPGDPKVAS